MEFQQRINHILFLFVSHKFGFCHSHDYVRREFLDDLSVSILDPCPAAVNAVPYAMKDLFGLALRHSSAAFVVDEIKVLLYTLTTIHSLGINKNGCVSFIFIVSARTWSTLFADGLLGNSPCIGHCLDQACFPNARASGYKDVNFHP